MLSISYSLLTWLLFCKLSLIYIIEIVHQDVFEKWEAMRAVKCAIILDPQQPVWKFLSGFFIFYFYFFRTVKLQYPQKYFRLM